MAAGRQGEAVGGATWAHRATRPLVRRLIGTRVTPNHLTALRLLTGLAAFWAFAAGAVLQGGFWHLLSSFLDRADGELARLAGRTSRNGHYFDLGSDVLVTSLLFVGMGIGLREDPVLGELAPILGIGAGLAVAAIFAVIAADEAQGRPVLSGSGVLDPDDVLFCVAPFAWAGWLPALLVAAAIGAPAFLGGLLFLRRKNLATGSRPARPVGD